MPFPALALVLALERELMVLNGDPIAPQSWLAIANAQLWICWDGPLGATAHPPATCWSALPRLDDVTGIRATFVDPDTVLLVDGDDLMWLLRRGASELEAAPGDLAPLGPLEALAPLPCSPTDWLPTWERDRWSWRPSPCESVTACAPTPKPRGRPSGLQLRLGVAATWWTAYDRALARSVGIDVVATIELGFDPSRLRAHTAQRRALTRAEAPRGVPAPRTTGDLGVAERDALARARCPNEVPQ